MNQYIEPLKTALLFFPFVALAITVPYMLVQYRKYGAILLLRTAIVYSFILYLMCAYFLTILPLPDVERVSKLTSPTIQLIPFREVGQLFLNKAVDIANPATYYHFFWNRNFFQIAANVVMLMPFGIYLRYYFGFGLKKTLLCSLGLSLVFELTQLSGLFGVYPRPYRLADVDDLMTNTLGGFLGYKIAPLLMRLLPSKERMDTVAYGRGTQVSVTRRIFAAMLDGILLCIAAVLVLWLVPALIPDTQSSMEMLLWVGSYYAAGILLYFVLGEWLLGGRTPGKMLARLRVVDRRTQGRPKLWQCAVRYVVLYIVVMPAPLAILLVLAMVGRSQSGIMAAMIVCMVLLLVYIMFWLLLTVHVFTHSIQLLHEKLSMTRNVSTLKVHQKHSRAVTEER
ncbi:MAG: VanZ family protein [Clostridia bacterium]